MFDMRAVTGVAHGWGKAAHFAVLLAAFIAAGAGTQAAAQTRGTGAQQSAFARVYAAPQNPAALLAYAKASAEIRDFEAVAVALERLLALQPANIAARKQLALAYFALGSNALAEMHLQRLAQAGGASDSAFAGQTRAYLDRARKSQDTQRLAGTLRLGTSLSPQSAPIAEADLGLTWKHDLNQNSSGAARGDVWLTALNAMQGWPMGAGQSAPFSASLRSGPQFGLGTARESARLQVFAAASVRGNLQGEVLRRAGAGLALQVPLGARANLVAEAGAGRLQASYSGTEGQFQSISLNANYRVRDRTTLRLRAERDDRRGLSTQGEVEQALSAEIWQEFRPAFSTVDRNWRVIGALQHRHISTNGGGSTALTAGAVLRGWISATSFADLGLSAGREDNGAGTRTDTTRLSVRFGIEF